MNNRKKKPLSQDNEEHKNSDSGSRPKLTTNLEIRENDIAKDSASASAIINYLNDKVRYLETENEELRKEIASNIPDKDKVGYYLRLRKDLLEEVEKLKSDMQINEMTYKTEIEKLNLEINELREKLNPPTREEKNLQDTLDRFIVNEQTSEQPENTFTQNSKFFKNIPIIKETDPEKIENIEKIIMSQKENQKASKHSVFNLSKKDNNNPFIPVIDDLEDRVKLLEKTIKDKEEDIEELKEVITTNQVLAERTQNSLQVEINKWKEKYVLILATRKTISQEFSELNIRTTESIKKNMNKQFYDLETKVLHLEKVNKKLNDDMANMVKSNAENEKFKDDQIAALKRDLKNLLDHYDELYGSYEESLKILTKQIDSIKQLYLARENEFLNITSYYNETIAEFTKPITDLVANQSNFKKLEDAFIHQCKQTEELRKISEKYIKENSTIKSENFESKALMRQKINDAMKFYDDSIKNISDNHTSIEEKLTKITEFMQHFDQKFILFNSIQEDKKELINRVNALETHIKMLDNNDNYKETIKLREENFKLSKDLEAKATLLREVEENQERTFLQASSHFSKKMKAKISAGSKEASIDSILKMRNEIALLNSQMIHLNRSKDDLQSFYRHEIETLIKSLENKNEVIDQLKTSLTKMENEYSNKKHTIFNLWMLEFKEFKENLISISDIRNIIDKFKIEGEELKIQRDKLSSEEIYLLRQEIKTKDNSIIELKNTYKHENKSINDLLDNYKKGIEHRMKTFDMLLSQKQAEVNALRNEKKRIIGIEANKKEITETELKLWNDQKENIKEFLQEHMSGKNKEIALLKMSVQSIESEMQQRKKHYDESIENLVKSTETQVNLIKERETFTANQLMELESKFNNLRDEKERLIELLKQEVEELRANNVLIGKLRNEKFMKENEEKDTIKSN